MNKYDVNQNYFNVIDSEDKAYFLGLVASDGCITDRNKLLVGLAEEDRDILEEFKKYIGYTGPLYDLKGRTSKHKNQTRLQIRNNSIFKALQTWGITERKSLTLDFPYLNTELLPHFIRGYFDGDGSVKFNKGVLYIRFVGTLEFLTILQDTFIKNCEVSKIQMYQANKDKNTFELTYGGDKQCIRIYDYMYKNATVFMKRKKKKFDEHFYTKTMCYYPNFLLYEELKRRKVI